MRRCYFGSVSGGGGTGEARPFSLISVVAVVVVVGGGGGVEAGNAGWNGLT